MIYETPEDWLARAAPAGGALRHVRARQDPDRGDAARRAATGSTTRSISASAPATWASTSSTTSSARRCATRSCAQLLRSDSIYIASNITFHNLAPLSTYLGKPGDPAKGGIPFDEYLRRQRQHRDAEIAATRDALLFIAKAGDIYGYEHFVCDTSGSLCEVVDPADPADPVLRDLAGATLPVWFRGTEDDLDALASRFDRAPKPMYYPEDFLTRLWTGYLADEGMPPRRSIRTPSSATAFAR